jgi:ribosome-associated protein
MTDDRLPVTPSLSIPRSELEARATRSGGPGGQHVNTSSTRIELTWNVRASAALSEEERARVCEKLAARIDGDGVLRVVSSAHRSQRRNRDAAEERLAELVRGALAVPKPRRKTRRPRAAEEARLEAKRRRAERKRGRGRAFDE